MIYITKTYRPVNRLWIGHTCQRRLQLMLNDAAPTLDPANSEVQISGMLQLAENSSHILHCLICQRLIVKLYTVVIFIKDYRLFTLCSYQTFCGPERPFMCWKYSLKGHLARSLDLRRERNSLYQKYSNCVAVLIWSAACRVKSPAWKSRVLLSHNLTLLVTCQ